MEKADLTNRIEKAIRLLAKNDWFLLIKKAHERSITHKLGTYLAGQFPTKWTVDCEYNRTGLDLSKGIDVIWKPKSGGGYTVNWELTLENADDLTVKEINSTEIENLVKEKYIVPDIVIHYRSKLEPEHNLLVVEAKNQDDAVDKVSLLDLRQL